MEGGNEATNGSGNRQARGSANWERRLAAAEGGRKVEKCTYQFDEAEYLHGWRPPAGALVRTKKTLFRSRKR